MPDRERVTEEFLERQVNYFGRLIERWHPQTAWDAANERALKYHKKTRNRWEKALERYKNEEKRKKKKLRRKCPGGETADTPGSEPGSH